MKPFQEYLQIPNHITLFEGQQLEMAKTAQVSATLSSDHSIVALSQDDQSVSLQAKEQGKNEMFLELAGFPVKKVDVNVLKDFKVIPGGQSIGVKLNTIGVLVVGHHQISTKEGNISPGELAGIQVGDIITEINGEKIEKMSEVAPYVQDAGQIQRPLKIGVTRENGKIETELMPQKEEGEANYKLGLYIRDSAAANAVGQQRRSIPNGGISR